MNRIFYLLAYSLIHVPIALFGQTLHLPEQVTIRRTEYGVPHIKAENLKAVAFGLAYCDMEDYGDKVPRALVRGRGDLALLEGYDAIGQDFISQQKYEVAVAKYHLIDRKTRDMLEGFAEGVNFYLKKHPQKYTKYQEWTFTGYDVAAVSTTVTNPNGGRNFVERIKAEKARRDSIAALTEAGSNAWAFAPSRTKSGNAILVRNPHLSWDAGYYEAHLIVEDTLNFYGDFRIGGLFQIIGGFNERLGFTTTNNYPDLDEIYALEADPEQPDHYLLDGTSFPLIRKQLQAEFKHGDAVGLETREFLYTPYGPVIHRQEGDIYILKDAGDKEYRRGEQFVRMMLAQNLEEFKDAMRMRAITRSNFTYADADGNIYYIWNAALPDISHPSGGDTAAIELVRSSQVWSAYIPFEEVPQLQNPKGGYLQNCNDPFYFANLQELILPEPTRSNYPEPRLRQRSQHSLSLIDNDQPYSLEEVVALKHSMNMLLANQVKDDLIALIRTGRSGREMRKVAQHLEEWDNRAHQDSRGGVLFEIWFEEYMKIMKDRELYATPWSFDEPMETPRGLADKEAALSAMDSAIAITTNKYGTWNLAWGEVHRIRRGDIDLPASGCPGGLGCFRVLWFEEDETDGKQRVRGGDGWVFAVEFGEPLKAYSILAYGQTDNPDSPHHTDQVELFANGEMKKVAFSEVDIEKNLVKTYLPGEE